MKENKNARQIAEQMLANKGKYMIKHTEYHIPTKEAIRKNMNISLVMAGHVIDELRKTREAERTYNRVDTSTVAPDIKQLQNIAYRIKGDDKYFKKVLNKDNIRKEFYLNASDTNKVCNIVLENIERERVSRLKTKLAITTKHIEDELKGIKY